MRRLAEYAPDCRKYKAMQAEAMVLLGKIEEAQNLAKYALFITLYLLYFNKTC